MQARDLTTAIGVAAGVGASFITARIVATMLFGIASTDVPTYVEVIVLTMLMVAGASAIPAWRAARLNPMTVIKAE